MSYDKFNESRKELVEKIIENMKNGYVLPSKKWDTPFLFSNPVSDTRYRGGNVVRLYVSAIEHEFQDPRWMTFKQAQSMGYKIKKGEHGTTLEKWIFEKYEKKKNETTGEMEKVKVDLERPIPKLFVVFNGNQIDGIEKWQEKQLSHNEVIETAEKLINTSECPIKYVGIGKAYYSPDRDEIVLPPRDCFKDEESFLSTTIHEMVHSTGHPTRLNRDQSGGFGSESYAKEELRAELGAFFVENDMGISLKAEHFNSHTQYLQSWIGALKNDPSELFRAISDAQKAVERLENNYTKVYAKVSEKELDKPQKEPTIETDRTKEKQISKSR